MSEISIKHNKHHIYQCPNDKKILLLSLLIIQNSNLSVVVVSSQNNEELKKFQTSTITIFNDEELINSDIKYDLVISYDLPNSVDTYIKRLSKALQSAITLIDKSEQKDLYPIETALKRVIKQEIISGFEYEKILEVEKPKKSFEKKVFDKPKFDKPKRDNRKPFDKPKSEKFKKDDKKPFNKPKEKMDLKEKKVDWQNKDKKQNKFLGKDENGKAIFSSKSGDRNHKYDGTKKDTKSQKPIKKIAIQSRKPVEKSE